MGPRLELKLAAYKGAARSVRRMAAFLDEHVREDLLAAIVHGSLGTGEEIAYSDFDALVIIRDATMRNPAQLAALARCLARSRQIMFEHDPLQHHGWFVLTEADLWCYNEALFPHTIIEHGRLIGGDTRSLLQLRPRDSTEEVRQAFLCVARSLQANLLGGRVLRNLYHLKSSLSLFMLLPCLYVHVRDGCGVFKKFSFEAARSDFGEHEWQPMVRVSQIRELWRYEISPVRRWLLSRPWNMRRRLARTFAPPVPLRLRAFVTRELQEGMGRLAVRMTEKLGLVKPVSRTNDGTCDAPKPSWARV